MSRSWQITFMTRRKRIIYEQRPVTLTVDNKRYLKHTGMEPEGKIGGQTPDDQNLEMTLVEISEEVWGEQERDPYAPWEIYTSEEEELGSWGQEISEMDLGPAFRVPAGDILYRGFGIEMGAMGISIYRAGETGARTAKMVFQLHSISEALRWIDRVDGTERAAK